MREILFKAKRVDGKGWAECFYYSQTCINKFSEAKEVLWVKHFIRNATDVLFDEIFEAVEVDPKTVSQYTGLLDKNGNKIFEGDRLHIGYNRLGIIIVSFERGSFSCVKYNLSKCQVIGNIHD